MFHALAGFWSYMSDFHREEGVVSPFPYMGQLIGQAQEAVTLAERKPLLVAMTGQEFNMTVDLAVGSS